MLVPVNEVIRRVRVDSMEYMQYFIPRRKSDNAMKWKPPDDSMLKVNLDGAYTPGNNYGCWGVVIRHELGHDVIMAKDGRCEHVHDAFGAELLAMSVAVQTAADLGAIRVIFETDSQLLADALDLQKVDSTPLAAVIEDTKYQLKLWFSKFSVNVCRRGANSVPHELARIGRLCCQRIVLAEHYCTAKVAKCVLDDLPEHR